MNIFNVIHTFIFYFFCRSNTFHAVTIFFTRLSVDIKCVKILYGLWFPCARRTKGEGRK